jgi:outer membrane lipase/esterase
LLSQVTAYLNITSNHVPNGTLVTVWAGANDFLKYFEVAGETIGSPVTAAGNVELAIQTLANAGGKYFLVPNLPDIGATPQFSGTPAAAGATAWVKAFNLYLALDLLSLEQDPLDAGINFYTLDVYNLFNSAQANLGTYGFTSISDMFWVDGLHPSTQAHSMIADYAASNVSEPATFILVILSLVGLAGFRKRVKR